MIKVTGLKAGADGTAEITAFADTKEEVTSGATIVGLPAGLVPAMGSAIITASGEVAFLKSDGSWNWVASSGGGGGGGSEVSITPTQNSGDKIADFEVDGVAGALYSKKELPTPSSQGVDEGCVLMVDNNNEWVKVNLYDYIRDVIFNNNNGFLYLESGTLETKSLLELLSDYPASALGGYASDGDIIKYDGNDDEWILGQP